MKLFVNFPELLIQTFNIPRYIERYFPTWKYETYQLESIVLDMILCQKTSFIGLCDEGSISCLLNSIDGLAGWAHSIYEIMHVHHSPFQQLSNEILLHHGVLIG